MSFWKRPMKIATAECTCSHMRGFHLEGAGCVGPYRGMRDDVTLCTCPAFHQACQCKTCDREAG